MTIKINHLQFYMSHIILDRRWQSSRLIMRDLHLLLEISSYNVRSQLIVKRDLDLYCHISTSSLVPRPQQRAYSAKIALIETWGRAR